MKYFLQHSVEDQKPNQNMVYHHGSLIIPENKYTMVAQVGCLVEQQPGAFFVDMNGLLTSSPKTILVQTVFYWTAVLTQKTLDDT